MNFSYKLSELTQVINLNKFKMLLFFLNKSKLYHLKKKSKKILFS